MYEKYKHRLSEAEFIDLGRTIYERDGFFNAPYFQYIVVACNQPSFDAVLYYLAVVKKEVRLELIERYSNEYAHAGGYTLRYYNGQTVVNILGLHMKDVDNYNHYSADSFFDVLAHEIQHLLIAYYQRFNINPVLEEEPHAYMSGLLMRKILRIVRANYAAGFIHVPNKVYGCVDGLGLLPTAMQPSVLTVLSGTVNQMMTNSSGLVGYQKGIWQATTYFSGGEYVERTR